jgi:hypothetical protein
MVEKEEIPMIYEPGRNASGLEKLGITNTGKWRI